MSKINASEICSLKFSARENVYPYGNPKLNELTDDYKLCNIIIEPASFKNLNLTYIDNFLTNKKTFMKPWTFKTGSS